MLCKILPVLVWFRLDLGKKKIVPWCRIYSKLCAMCCMQDGETRNVKQFHFTAWPDHGVPQRASPIISFRRKVRSYDQTHPGLILVHCRLVMLVTQKWICIKVVTCPKVATPNHLETVTWVSWLSYCRLLLIIEWANVNTLLPQSFENHILIEKCCLLKKMSSDFDNYWFCIFCT